MSSLPKMKGYQERMKENRKKERKKKIKNLLDCVVLGKRMMEDEDPYDR